MAAKFKLKPNPTFKADVTIPVPGDEPGIVTFTFKHRPIKELADLEKVEGKHISQFLLEITEGWALSDEFNQSNVETLLDNYPRAGEAIMKAYYAELLGNREKN